LALFVRPVDLPSTRLTGLNERNHRTTMPGKVTVVSLRLRAPLLNIVRMPCDHRSHAAAIIGNSLERRFALSMLGIERSSHSTGLGIPYHQGLRPLDLVRHRGRHRI